MISSTDFLDSAKELAQNKNETAFRNSISRAYYCAYHAVLPLDESLANHGGIKTDVGVHEQLISKLENCPRSVQNWATFKSIGVLMRYLKKLRVEADYDLASEISIEQAQQQIKQAEKVLAKISEIKKVL